MYGPTQEFARDLYQEKYCGPNETIDQAYDRFSRGLADNEEHRVNLLDIFGSQRFMPGGRIQSAIGSVKETTAYNCFVSGRIDDSFVEGSASIMARLHEAATTMRMGGGIGYNFSTLRPKKALIKKLLSHSSGPISFMGIYDANGLCCSSAGHRRGAQMGVLNIDHPDIEEFVACKQAPPEAQGLVDALDEMEPNDPQYWPLYNALQATLKLKGFNISIGMTDEFMIALTTGKTEFPLRFGGKVVKVINPQELWEKIMRSTWAWAEPGILFLDTINRLNNLYYCEELLATNPCGEQPLPEYGACLLGSFNLVKYLVRVSAGVYGFDWDMFRHDIPHVVRAMDNVVDRTKYPLREQEREAQNKRRMGLGITGLANAAEALGLPYGSPDFLVFEANVLKTLRNHAYLAGAYLANEKGSFPLFNAEKYLAGEYVKKLPPVVRDAIAKYGIRNSHYTSIAPTGTISFTADNVSSSIEPPFSYETERKVNRASGPVVQRITDYGFGILGVKGRRVADVTVKQHLDVLATAQEYIDSAVSKTCNVPSDTPWDDFKNLYVEAWRRGCKGITTYQVGGRRAGIMTSKDTDAQEGQTCTIDAATGRRNCE